MTELRLSICGIWKTIILVGFFAAGGLPNIIISIIFVLSVSSGKSALWQFRAFYKIVLRAR